MDALRDYTDSDSSGDDSNPVSVQKNTVALPLNIIYNILNMFFVGYLNRQASSSQSMQRQISSSRTMERSRNRSRSRSHKRRDHVGSGRSKDRQSDSPRYSSSVIDRDHLAPQTSSL